jgi:NAD(P)H-hydrate epimerase
MARLLGTNTQEVQSNRLAIAEQAAREMGCVVLLKGAPTIIASPAGERWLNPTGTPGMATGGTGDVLTGLIVGLLAQGLGPLDAAISGAFLHGCAGKRAARRLGEAGMLAGDVLAAIPHVLHTVYGRTERTRENRTREGAR